MFGAGEGMNYRVSAVILSIALLLLPASMSGQNQEDKVKDAVAKRGTGEKAKVIVTTNSGTKIKGYIASAGPNTFELRTETGSTQTFSYTDVAKVQKPGLSLAAKIGIGFAAAALLVAVASLTGAGDLGP
jgi:hypothetical protein